MAILSIDPIELARLIRERRECGGDRYDEVWDGVYVMSPLADNEHQELGVDLSAVMKLATGFDKRIRIFAGCNVSDRPRRWNKNYRCPDVAVFLPGNPAEDRGTHWFGGPDFAVEILSPLRSFSRKIRLLRQGRRPRADARRAPAVVAGALQARWKRLRARRPVRSLP